MSRYATLCHKRSNSNLALNQQSMQRMPSARLSIVAFLCIILATASAIQQQAPKDSDDFYKGSKVIELEDGTFEDVVRPDILNHEHERNGWLIEFYAPWCSHCQKFKPTWKKVGALDPPIANVGAINVKSQKFLTLRFLIKSYPTIIFLFNGQIYQYSGKRTVEGIKQFVAGGYKEVTPTRMSQITDVPPEFQFGFQFFKLLDERPLAVFMVLAFSILCLWLGLYICYKARQAKQNRLAAQAEMEQEQAPFDPKKK